MFCVTSWQGISPAKKKSYFLGESYCRKAPLGMDYRDVQRKAAAAVKIVLFDVPLSMSKRAVDD